MAYAAGSVIQTDDLGKIINNTSGSGNNAEMANYNLFTVTTSATISSVTKYFTTFYARGSGTVECTAIAQPKDAFDKTKTGRIFHYALALSGTVFSTSGGKYYENGSHSVTIKVVQVRGIM